MIRIILFVLSAIITLNTKAQITLDECQQAAQENYPLVRQYNLIQLSEQYTVSNVEKGNLPQISVSGKISYQSDATTLPFEIPGIGFRGLSKDQYQAIIEVKQNIWDGGKIHNQKEEIKAVSRENKRQLDVSMYALHEQVNQVYFGILLLNEQLHQNSLLNENLQRNLKNIEAYRNNGIANDADVDAVKVEILNTKQQRTLLSANRHAYLHMLALLTGKTIDDNTQFVVPKATENNESYTSINRPELQLYEAQEQTLYIRQRNLRAGYMPQLGFFAQGGYGNPGLDMLKDKFTAYYMVGARLTWNFGSLYTLKNDKQKLDILHRQIQNNRDVFLFKTQLKLTEQDGIIKALRQQMIEDDEMIRLRSNIRQAAEAKVANGTLTVTEMLREVTSESLARQTQAIHKIQLLMNLYNRKHLTNSPTY